MTSAGRFDIDVEGKVFAAADLSLDFVSDAASAGVSRLTFVRGQVNSSALSNDRGRMSGV